MALQVKDKVALVTGGGSGICFEFTKLLLSQGCSVVVADLSLRPEAEEVIERNREGTARAIFQKTDVTDWAQLQGAFDTAIKEFGRLDIVCPGAGIFEPVSWPDCCGKEPSFECPKRQPPLLMDYTENSITNEH
jgi:3-hydroxybutyrate dehydrogenase